MALYPIDPYAFANSSQYQDAMNRPSEPAQPDLVSQFLERLMSALEEDEPSAEEMVAPARSPAQGFRLGVQNAYAWQPEEQRAERGNLLYEQQLGAMDEARQRPAKVAQMQQAQRDRGLQRMTQGLNVASLMEQRKANEVYRQAQIQKLQSTSPQDDKVMIPVRQTDPQTGQVSVTYVPRGVARQMFYTGQPIEVVSDVPSNAFIPTSDGYMLGQRKGDPNISPLGGPGGQTLYPPAPGWAVKDLQQQMALAQQLREGMSAFNALAKSMSTGGRVALDLLRQLPGGSLIAGWVTPQGELTAKALNIARDTVLRIASGAQISEPEAARIGAFLPRVGDSPQAAAGAFAQTFDRLATALETQMSVRPDLVPPSLVFEIRQMAQEARQASQSTPQTKILSNGKRAVLVNGQWMIED